MNAVSNKVRLITSDGKVVEVDTKIIKLSNWIKTKMEDQPEFNTIQLPNVNAAILNKVIQWCEYHKTDPPPLDENNKKRTDDEVRSWDAEFLKANQGDLYDLSLAAHYMDIEGLLDLTTPIRQLPSELLVKIIDKLPRPQWTDLELIDQKFRDATLLAWESLREVDIERDFIYSKSEAIKDENDDHYDDIVSGLLRRQIAGKTESIMKTLFERSPRITSLIGVSLMADDSTLNTTAVQYLTRFEHLETVKFAKNIFSGQVVSGREIDFSVGIPLINFVEFFESTQSRATLKEICIDQCDILNNRVMAANFDQRLRAAFASVPTRPLLQLEAFSTRMNGGHYPLTFYETIDASRMTKLSLGYTAIEPNVLATLIAGAPRLQHLDFAFLKWCGFYANTARHGVRRQSNKDLLAVLGSHPNLTSLGFNSIWNGCSCDGFETEFKYMLCAIAPQLVNFVFKPGFLATGSMDDIRDIIQRHMPNLKSITLDECCATYPEELGGIADGKELEEIEIVSNHSSFNNNYEGILNDVLSSAIIDKSPRLKRFIGINYHPNQRPMVELCKLSELVDLRIRADKLTKENFVTFSQQVFAKKLEILHLGRIGEGAESGLIDLVSRATRLRELVVGRNVTDKLLECLANSCPNLEKFSVSLADGITIEGIQMLVDLCKKLRWLHVEDADGPLTSALKNLKLDQYRKLEINFF